jgi:hypothetical protein
MKIKTTKKLTTQEFIRRSILINNDYYDYSLVVYINNKRKVKIICKIHGMFEQSPHDHLIGCGCPKCGGKLKSNTEDFIKKADIIHNNLYDYSLVNYIDAYTKIKIICCTHGIFLQRPTRHLSGDKCPKCHGNYKPTIEEFIEKSNKIHNSLYNYSKSIYINNRTKIIIICNLHGEFEQVPDSHLQGHGCPSCSHVISKSEVLWLDSLKIPYDFRNKSIKINKKLFKPDAVDDVNKIIYEFYGDFWHGNPNIFDANLQNKVIKKSFGELYQKTINKENILKKAGYKVISIWESDWNKIKSGTI